MHRCVEISQDIRTSSYVGADQPEMSRRNHVDIRSKTVDSPFHGLLAYNGVVVDVCHSHRVTPAAMHQTRNVPDADHGCTISGAQKYAGGVPAPQDMRADVVWPIVAQSIVAQSIKETNGTGGYEFEDSNKPFRPVIIKESTKKFFEVTQEWLKSDEVKEPWEHKQDSFNKWWGYITPATFGAKKMTFQSMLTQNKEVSKTTRKAVVCFRDEYFWLSNMFPTMVNVEANYVIGMEEWYKWQRKWNACIVTTKQYKGLGDPRTDKSVIEKTIKMFDPKKMLLFPSVEHGFVCGKIKIAQLGILLLKTYIEELNAKISKENVWWTHSSIPAMVDDFKGACEMWEMVRMQDTAKQAKAMGQKHDEKNPQKKTIPPKYLHDMKEWDKTLGVEWMTALLRAKFSEDESGHRHHLHDLLKSLKGYLIVEGNYYKDADWGCKIVPYEKWIVDSEKPLVGILEDMLSNKVVLVGKNQLGVLLMQLCDKLTEKPQKPEKPLLLGYNH